MTGVQTCALPILNGILGTAGEAGELVDLLKKQIFQGHPLIESILPDRKSVV